MFPVEFLSQAFRIYGLASEGLHNVISSNVFYKSASRVKLIH